MMPTINKNNIENLISQLTLEEKAALCSGLNNWQTKPIDRLGIPSLYLTDSPHGLRKDVGDSFGSSHPATCFPTASAMAATWNTELIEEAGAAIGRECQSYGVHILLGPGCNIKRSPLGGRNFESFSEDPVLSGEMAAAFINGVQSEGVGTSLKHFTANNQEFECMIGNSVVDQRTLREVYLPAFEIAVQKAQPWTVMAAYNKINGVFGSENSFLLQTILKNEFGLEGIVITDWGGVNDRVEAIKAGCHLEMPGSYGINDKKIVTAVKNGELSMSRLDEIVLELLQVIFKCVEHQQADTTFDQSKHHQLAQKVAEESIVLLKNENDILPLLPEKNKTIAILGRFAKTPRFQGAGSSNVNPTQTDDTWSSLQNLVDKNTILTYSDGYDEHHHTNEHLLNDAQRQAAAADVAVIFVGLPDSFESEGFDRTHIDLPQSHRTLIDVIQQVQKRVVVVLANGSAVAMPWIEKVDGILEGWLGGQAGGTAIAQVLTGKVNPSGKLSETFPARLEDSPAFLDFPRQDGVAIYGELSFVGYKYYQKRKIAPLFPFGFGLSYTTFELQNLKMNAVETAERIAIQFSVDVKNTGEQAGAEVVQIYLAPDGTDTQKPLRTLKAFEKIHLQPGESATLHFELREREFAHFCLKNNRWEVQPGTFTIEVGTSVENIQLTEEIDIDGITLAPLPIHPQSMVKDLRLHPNGTETYEQIVQTMMPQFTKTAQAKGGKALEEAELFFTAIIHEMPLYKLPIFSGGSFTEEDLEQLIEKVNNG